MDQGNRTVSYQSEFSTIFHQAVSVWQERPLEMSWKCSCGLIHKHQAFGDLRCADDASDGTGR